MKFTRRHFLKIGGTSTAAGIAPLFLASENAQAGLFGSDAVATPNFRRADQNSLPEVEMNGPSVHNTGERTCIPTSCLQCVAICGVNAYREGDQAHGRIAKLEGNPYSPNNMGMTCAKGQAGMNQTYDPDRIIYPLKRVGKRGEGKWKRISWDEALTEVAEKMKEPLDAGHPEEIMFHYGRSRIKPWVKNFFNAALGTKTIGNHTSICETSKWTGQELVFGKHYDVNDFPNTNMILNFGCNPLEAHTAHSYIAQRLVDAVVDGNVKLVTFDVRASNTATLSSQWHPIKPGTDAAVILAMCKVIMDEGLYNEKFINDWTSSSVSELKAHLAPFTPEFAETESGIDAEVVRNLAIEYANAKPGTCLTYRGFVGHYNGTYAEMSAKMLDAICGYIGIKGGTNPKPSGKWEDPFKAIQKKVGTAKTAKLKIVDGENLVVPTHHASHRVLEMIKSGEHGRPKVYLTYTYNPAYVSGDCAENIEILKDESLIPYYVACDVAMSESAELADLILPDSTYLERWTSEAPQSYSFTKFIQVRQPVTDPLGEAKDFQQILLELAKKLGGNIAKLMPYDDVEEYYREAVAKTYDKYGGYGVDGEPISGDPWDYITKYGFIYQTLEPHWEAHLKEVSPSDGDVVDKDTNVLWNPKKAHVSEDDVKAKGYRGSKSAYKGYKGQKVGNKFYAGFKPDKVNKSGLIEIKTPFLQPGTKTGDKLQKIIPVQLAGILKEPKYSYLSEHLKSGLPTYLPVPEHVMKTDDELIMISYKVSVQIHSRSQNCKYLSELYHDNPAWLNTATARKMNINDGDTIKVSYVDKTYPERAYNPPRQTSITIPVRVTEMIHPDVVGISMHCGHWAYGRYASGKPVGGNYTGESVCDMSNETKDWKSWNHGVHPNWIIPNAPDPISGQWRSNDTVVTVERV